MARLLSRPRGLLTERQAAYSSWARAFGHIDTCPTCDHCGATLTRRAVLDGNMVWGADCFATAFPFDPVSDKVRGAARAKASRDEAALNAQRQAASDILDTMDPNLVAEAAKVVDNGGDATTFRGHPDRRKVAQAFRALSILA